MPKNQLNTVLIYKHVQEDIDYPQYFETYEDAEEELPSSLAFDKRAWNSGLGPGMGKRAWNSGIKRRALISHQIK